MTGVYDAYASRLGYENVRLEIEEQMDRELFADYQESVPDEEKAQKVLRTVRRELGLEACESICQAAAGWDLKKADAIFRTIVLGLHLPKKKNVMSCLTKDYVCTVAQLAKKTWNEAHRMMGFVRFTELSGGILYAAICPENDLLWLLAPHFADRFQTERWVLYDEGRDLAALHSAGKGFLLLEKPQLDKAVTEQLSEKEEDYRAMWQAFTKSVAIGARKNEQLQKQLLPLKFRDRMTEFKKT